MLLHLKHPKRVFQRVRITGCVESIGAPQLALHEISREIMKRVVGNRTVLGAMRGQTLRSEKEK